MKIYIKQTTCKYPFSEPVLRKMMCTSQMLWYSGGKERDHHPGVNLCVKSILAGRNVAILLTTKCSTELQCPAHHWCCSEHLQRQVKTLLYLHQASTGMDRAGMQKGMENPLFTRRAFQKHAFHCRAAIRMQESTGLKRRGKNCWIKLFMTSSQLMPWSSSSPSMASSSFTGICSHRGETPWTLKTPSNFSIMKYAHGKKNK